MSFDFKLPDLGEGIREAEILGIKITEGQSIKEDAPLFEVETDKAVVEIPSPVAGKVSKIYVRSGEIVPVGTVMVSIETTSGSGADQSESAKKIQDRPHTGIDQPKVSAPTAEVIATPATRQFARELGIDIHLVHGSGPGGKVTKEDITAYAESNKGKSGQKAASTTSEEAFTLPDFRKWGKIERVPIRSIRRKTAQLMSMSWSKIPHVTHCDEANISELENLRRENDNKNGKRLTLTPFLLKAITIALEKFPEFNASLDEKTDEIILKHYYNIGMAVATERGLIVPVIKNTDKKNISQLSAEVNEIADKTRNGKIELEELQGGSFTLTNIGAIGGTSATPIISYPESAILAVMQSKEKAIVRQGKIEIGLILPLCLAFDHRLTDGAEAARFVQTIVKILEEPKILAEQLG